MSEEVIKLICIIIFIILINIVDIAMRKYCGIKNQKRVKGKIINSLLADVDTIKKIKTYYADVEYEVDGEKYVVRSKHAQSDYNKLGKKVWVTYDSKYPSHAIVELHITDLLYAVIGFVILIYIIDKIV